MSASRRMKTFRVLRVLRASDVSSSSRFDFLGGDPGCEAYLGRGVGHVDLAEDGVAVVGQHDT